MRLAVALGLGFVIGIAAMLPIAVAIGGVDVLLVVSLIGLLLARELLGAYSPQGLRSRLGILVFLGFLLFAWIVVARVREILRI